jgi:hypothetical protein
VTGRSMTGSAPTSPGRSARSSTGTTPTARSPALTSDLRRGANAAVAFAPRGRSADIGAAPITERTSVARVSSPTSGLVPVHVGQPEPGPHQERPLAQRPGRTRERLPRVPAGLAWQQHGVEPRWLGMETSDCVVAVEPSIFHSHGADELERFLAGARRRGELALVVAVIGDVTDDSPRSVMYRFDASVHLSKTFTSVSGRRLPAGTRPEIAPDLDPADRDLAIRLLTRPADAPWWGLHLSAAVLERGDGSGSETHEAEGELHPILVDALGEPVVAAWTPSGDQRWYVIPDATDWDNMLGWLVHRALPEYVPAALRRARSPHFVDPDLQTAAELAARQAVTELEARYAEEKLRLEADLRRAEAVAAPVRYGLLYGSGAELVAAVAEVLTAAGLTTVDLDEALGDTKSADLLVSAGGQRRLVEVKAASGPAQESLVGHLRRHLDTWPQLRPGEPVSGGVLVVNHQHKRHPSERMARVYSRPEFVDALTVPVISTVELFSWWRTSDWAPIRAAVLGAEPPTTGPGSTAPTSPTLVVPAEPTAPPPRRRWWQGARAQWILRPRPQPPHPVPILRRNSSVQDQRFVVLGQLHKRGA